MFFDNIEVILQAVGGLGLFLFGIAVMTDGLRALGGDTMRSALMRFTRSPLSGAITGAVTTAMLRSSSATTVAAVGFVGAGLLTFPQSLGIIFGANIGTTITGWIVALLGFKLKLGSVMLPFVLIGAIMRLFGKGRLAHTGYAIAGFALVFVGISFMQQGMSGFQGIITPDLLPPDTFTGRLKLVALGIAFTLVAQSSSAGVATALTALYGGAINFEQAAALVIGMDVGTTVTAALATIGGSVNARRTGFSHVIYNIFTGILAIILITPYIMAVEMIAPGQLTANAEISLVAFHTTFNLLGVMIVLPFTHAFARLIIKLIPEKMPLYTRTLDEILLKEPGMALTAVQNSIYAIMLALLAHISVILGDTKRGRRANLPELQEALDRTHAYIDKIHLSAESGAKWERLVAMIHTLDHMQRLHERCEEEEDRAITVRESKKFSVQRKLMTTSINKLIEDLESRKWHKSAKHALKTKATLYKQIKPYREVIMAQIARGEIDVPKGTDYLEGIRWLKRVNWHMSRITQHYEDALLAAGK
ncbi:MAG: Na/Pi symporter [Campylobacterota bacterium]|nr:Na/Pi symporter [Campylobacterota bacterium]